MTSHTKPKKSVAESTQKSTLRKLLVVYEAIDGYQRENNYDSPSMDDLVQMVNDAGDPLIARSSSVVSRYYRIMVELRMIRWTPRRSRAVHLLDLAQADPVVLEIMQEIEKEKSAQ